MTILAPDPVEWLCMIVTFVGVIASIRILLDVMAERAALRRAHERGEVVGDDYEAKHMINRASVRGINLAGILIAAGFVLSAIWGLFTPPVVRTSVTIASVATSVFILIATVIAVIALVINGRERKKLYDLARRVTGATK